MSIHVYRLAVRRAEQVLGDSQRLARYLRVSPRELDAWRSGAELPPLDVFVSCVEVIVDDERPGAAQLYRCGRRSGRAA